MIKQTSPLITDLDLERYMLDELPRQRRDMIQQQLKIDIELRDRLNKIDQFNEAILHAYPPSMISTQVISRHSRT